MSDTERQAMNGEPEGLEGPEATEGAKDGRKLKDPQLKKVVGGLSTPAVKPDDPKLNAVAVVKPPRAHK